MNKTNLQKELKEKVKPGIKPSDLKKQREKKINLNEDEGYISDNPSRNNRNNKNSLNKSEKKKIQELEKEIKFWSQTANNHLSSLQREQAENEDLKEEIKELKKIKPTKTQQELEKSLQEANQKIRDQEKEIINLNHNITWANGEIKEYKERIKELNKIFKTYKSKWKVKEKTKNQLINPSFVMAANWLNKGLISRGKLIALLNLVYTEELVIYVLLVLLVIKN